MKRIALLSFFLVLLVSGCAKKPPENHYSSSETLYDLYKPLIVQVKTEFAKGGSENGFGFIVGEDEAKENFYIVTANHVVRKEVFDNPTVKIEVRLPWGSDEQREVKLLGNYSNKNELDLAFLLLKKKETDQSPWKGQTWCGNWKEKSKDSQVRTPVCFIGWKKKMQLSPETGTLIKRIPSPSRIEASIKTIQPGNSGTPLINDDGGIVGMAVEDNPQRDEVIAVDIINIKSIVDKIDSCIWKLGESDCVSIGCGHVKIVWRDSVLERAEKISKALKEDCFTTELIKYDAWISNINNSPKKYDLPGIAGNNLFFRKTAVTGLTAAKIQNIVQQLPLNIQLKKKPLTDMNIVEALTIEETSEMLIVLNETPSLCSQLIKWLFK